jgi:hypothetical protein
VIGALEQADYRNSEASLPTHATGGTFSALGGGSGMNAEVRWWGASADELADLRACVGTALRATGLDVHELDSRIYDPGTRILA